MTFTTEVQSCRAALREEEEDDDEDRDEDQSEFRLLWEI